MDIVDLWKMIFHLILRVRTISLFHVDAKGRCGIWKWKIMEDAAFFQKIASLIWRFPKMGGFPQVIHYH
jgi:hypothetical protein